jgi:hypothetical protein
MLLGRHLLLRQIILSFFVEHEVVIILGNEALDLSIFAVLQLKKGECFPEHSCIEGLEFVVFKGVVKFVDRVISELVVEIEVPI